MRDATDLFSSIYRRTGGVDGRVSIEVDPRLAHDTDGTIAQAQELCKIVDRPNLLIKIPATPPGCRRSPRCIAKGISVNVTLIFSLDRYRAVMDAYLTGLEQAKANGHNLSDIHSVASFFVSRVDLEIDKRLKAIGTPRPRPCSARRPSPTPGWPTRRTSRRPPATAVGRPRRGRSEQAAPAVGIHRREGPGLRRHPLRRRAGRPRHRQHRTGEDHQRRRRPRRDPRQHHRGTYHRRRRCSPTCGARHRPR